jgi:hypothetical protein
MITDITFCGLQINTRIEETMFLIVDMSVAVHMGSKLRGEDND